MIAELQMLSDTQAALASFYHDSLLFRVTKGYTLP